MKQFSFVPIRIFYRHVQELVPGAPEACSIDFNKDLIMKLEGFSQEAQRAFSVSEGGPSPSLRVEVKGGPSPSLPSVRSFSAFLPSTAGGTASPALRHSCCKPLTFSCLAWYQPHTFNMPCWVGERSYHVLSSPRLFSFFT